jgi:isocitrate dehydrogenase
MSTTLTIPAETIADSEQSPNVPASPITVAYGDGIGPEIMASTLKILSAAAARLDVEPIEIGESVYKRGHSSGIEPEAWDSLRRTKVFLKAPITTPQGGGFKSLNVTIRKTLGLYANVRPAVAYHPYVKTRHPGMNVVIIRENEEDLYAGIEHRQTDEVYQCLKIISRPGTEKVIRFAFEYAKLHSRKRVTCFTKDNIMKLTDGLFHKVFEEIAAEYPQIGHDHMIVDIGAARLADRPEIFDVIVMPNLYGDILSDVAAEIAGSVGLAGSANIGDHVAMFEAIHGSAPDIAGKGIANPSGLLLSAVMMLVHLGQCEEASLIHNAFLRTLEDGIHTPDIYDDRTSLQRASTDEFTQAVIDRLGKLPRESACISYPRSAQMPAIRVKETVPAKKELVGVDIFVHSAATTPNRLAERLKAAETDRLELQLITNRGVKVWPNGAPETFCTDHWRCRYISRNEQPISPAEIINALSRVSGKDLDFIKTENLYTFDGTPGFSLGQGQ